MTKERQNRNYLLKLREADTFKQIGRSPRLGAVSTSQCQLFVRTSPSYLRSTFRKSLRNPELESLTNSFTLFLIGTPCTGDVRALQSLFCSSSSFSIFSFFWPQFATLPLTVDTLLVTELLDEQFVSMLDVVTTCAFI